MTDEQPVSVAREPYHKVVFENEYLRILNVEIPPQHSTLLHRHEHDYYVLVVGAAEIEDHALDVPCDRKTFRGGEMTAGKAGFTHMVKNVGAVPFRNVVVELK